MDRQAFGDGHADDVRQVVLFLRVVVRQPAEPFAEARGGHGHDAGVDFTDVALFGGSVLLFDDAHHLPGLVAHDAPVAGRVCEFDGEDGQRTMGSLHQGFQGFGADQWHITIKD